MKNKIEKIVTVHDMCRARQLAKAKFDVWNDLHQKATVEHCRVMGILNDHPEIGVLMRNGEPVYYRSAPAYREASDPAELVLPCPEVIRAEDIGYGYYVLVYEGGIRQQCSRERYYAALERLNPEPHPDDGRIEFPSGEFPGGAA